jgi:hypothetical protein
MNTRPDFPTRLALARAMVASGARPLPVDIADQTRAAGREMHRSYGRLGAVLPLLEPQRNWRQRTDLESRAETRALLLAGLLGCVDVCVHLRRQGPQPAYCRLPLRRVDCIRCVHTHCRPVTDADECDLCGAPETLVFHPFAVQIGPMLMAGDVCADCAAVLGIRATEAAS